jgi:hypothetical protein
MTPEQKRLLAEDIRMVCERTGSGPNRRFVNKVDLSFEGVNKWREKMGLAPMTTKEYQRLNP